MTIVNRDIFRDLTFDDFKKFKVGDKVFLYNINSEADGFRYSLPNVGRFKFHKCTFWPQATLVSIKWDKKNDKTND